MIIANKNNTVDLQTWSHPHTNSGAGRMIFHIMHWKLPHSWTFNVITYQINKIEC